MTKSEIRKVKKEKQFYKIELSKSNSCEYKFEIWKKNKRYGYYNFICYSNSNEEEHINNLILKQIKGEKI